MTDHVLADVEGIVGDTRTLSEILDELLSAADTRTQTQWTSVDIGGLVADVAGSTAATAEKSGVTLTVTPGASGPAIEGSSSALRRALLALLENAVGHARSAVVIAVRASADRVDIQVTDDGPGIPKDVAPRLFDRFSSHRAEAPVPGAPRHYGLGLALVADVAANHQAGSPSRTAPMASRAQCSPSLCRAGRGEPRIIGHSAPRGRRSYGAASFALPVPGGDGTELRHGTTSALAPVARWRRPPR